MMRTTVDGNRVATLHKTLSKPLDTGFKAAVTGRNATSSE